MFTSLRSRLLAIVLLINAITVISYTTYTYQARKTDLYQQIDAQLTLAAQTAAHLRGVVLRWLPMKCAN